MKKHLATAAIALTPSLAFAHPGHEAAGLFSGLSHPLLGLDHLLAMLAIGIWAALQQDKIRLAIPLTFVGVMLAGFVLGVAGFVLPMVESGVALSVLLLGLIITLTARLPASASLVLTAVFALFHGYAHGAEASGSLALFAVGFSLTSLLLHLSGAGLAIRLRQLPAVVRSAGIAIAASGLWMMS